MAALCPGVQYGLSSQESFGENKDLIFVKLTDSALRTIEEFLRNQVSFYLSYDFGIIFTHHLRDSVCVHAHACECVRVTT